MKLLFCDGMKETEGMGMESLTVDERIIRTVQEITGQRVTDIGHVHPYLMGAPGFQTKAYQGNVQPFMVRNPAVVSAGGFSKMEVYFPLDNGISGPGNGGIDDPFHGDFAQSYGQIFPVYLPLGHHGRKDTGGKHMFGYDQKSGSILIQPAGSPVDKRNIPGRKIVGEPVGKGVGEVPERRVDRNSGRFVDD